MMDSGTQTFGLFPWCEVVFSPLYKCTSLAEPFLGAVITLSNFKYAHCQVSLSPSN